MPRWLMAVLGIALLGGIGVLVWQLQAEPDRPTRGAAARPAQRRSPASAPDPLTGPPAKAGSPEVDDAPAPRGSVEQTSKQYLEKLFSRTVPNEIMRAVSGCYSGEAGNFERMAFEFTVEFNEGVAMLDDVALVKSANLPQLEECAVDVMRSLTWSQRRAPNMKRTESIEISVNDLVKRHKQFIRRDEEEAGD